MNYLIELDNNYQDKKSFPDILSYFFEQAGGYGDASVVCQIEKILNIDLSIFQRIYYIESEVGTVAPDMWIELSDLISIVDLWIEQMNSNPYYFTKVIFNDVDINNLINVMSVEELTRYISENLLSKYPYNNGLLNEKVLKKAVSEFRISLSDFQKQQVHKIRFLYG